MYPAARGRDPNGHIVGNNVVGLIIKIAMDKNISDFVLKSPNDLEYCTNLVFMYK